MKQVTKFSIGIITFFGLLLAMLLHNSQEILIESLESKTILGDPVFNKINLFQFKDQDVWMMNQSHHGPIAPKEAWDRLAIVVNKTSSPKTVRFYQLEPGTLKWKENLPEKPYRVSCFMCHNNGPRAIRPNFESSVVSIGSMDRAKIGLWNLRIKLYGRMVPDKMQVERDARNQIPFRLQSSYENEILKTATCNKCHNDDGFLSRGFLHRQQIPTIRFMVESGNMPPLGFSLSKEDKVQLERFMMGF